MKDIMRVLDQIRSAYDGDHDVIPGAPRVTWADERLATALSMLLEMVESHERQHNTKRRLPNEEHNE